MQAIVHCDKNWGIGKKNDLMFHLPKDMAFFKMKTAGKVVVMGSNTLLSFPKEKPLKNRTNIVLWPGGDHERAKRDGFILVESLDELFEELKKYYTWDIYIIGGAMMYHTMLPYCEYAYITKVDEEGNADVFFDNLDEHPDWELNWEDPWQDDNGHRIKFTLYKNKTISSTSPEALVEF